MEPEHVPTPSALTTAPARRSAAWLLRSLLSVLLLTLLAPAASAQEGTIQLPLARWEALTAALQNASPGFAMGNGTVVVNLTGDQAAVQVDVTAQILQAGAVVPLLPAGVIGAALRVDGQAAPLTMTSTGLGYTGSSTGSRALVITYQVPVRRESGTTLAAIPVPPLSGGTLRATLPSGAQYAGVVPGSASANQSGATLNATLPATAMVQIAFTGQSSNLTTISRANYRGTLQSDLVTWRGEFTVHQEAEGVATLELLPDDVTLVSLDLDGEAVPIRVVNGSFAVPISGRGTRRVVAQFQTPVLRDRGSPRVDLEVPLVPVSRFELTLPGEKQVTATPTTGVQTTVTLGNTTAVLHTAMTPRLSLSWNEAVPEAVAVETRANVQVWHLFHAEERLLTARAIAEFEVARGEMTTVNFAVPSDVQINTISSPQGGILDWRVEPATAEAPAQLTVFLDRGITGTWRLQLEYERTIGTVEDAGEIALPLLLARSVSRQRGMIALLQSDELVMTPVAEEGTSRVGENQLPADIRDMAGMTVGHTFRYIETEPQVRVRLAEPPRREGRFDAQVDTLVSLSDVTTRLTATIEISVKAGGLQDLQLRLPAGVNLLNLTAPSLRQQNVTTEGNEQIIALEFTQQMEGFFRIEAAWERISANQEGDADLPIPRMRVPGAEVEQGRIAVEALTAVEVYPAQALHLSTMDLSELPRQLVMRTTNPILLAYKYVQATPAPSLSLRVVRHAEIEVRTATADEAVYQTLYTADGFAVTQARFLVRNRRQQFLRLTLPAAAEVWSARVDGREETPALADGEGDTRVVLVPIINADRAFPVEVTWRTPVPSLGAAGRVRMALPRPDVIVTRTEWVVWLPDSVAYGEPDGDLQLVSFTPYGQGDAAAAMLRAPTDGSAPLAIPTSGWRATFTRLYASEQDPAMAFHIPYVSAQGAAAGGWLIWLGTLGIWLGVVLLVMRRLTPHIAVPRLLAPVALGLGLLLVLASAILVDADWRGPASVTGKLLVGLALLAAGVLGARRIWAWARAQAMQVQAGPLSNDPPVIVEPAVAPPTPEPVLVPEPLVAPQPISPDVESASDAEVGGVTTDDPTRGPDER